MARSDRPSDRPLASWPPGRGSRPGRAAWSPPSKMGGSYEVNNAHVVCANAQTANATVYIIGTVLMPPAE